MRETKLLTVTAVAHAVIAIGCLASVVVLSRNTMKAHTIAGGPARLHNLYVSAICVSMCALLYGLVAAGLWERRRRAWFTAVAVDALLAALILPLAVGDGELFDFDVGWPALMFLGLAIVLLLPAVRHALVPPLWVWRDERTKPSQS